MTLLGPFSAVLWAAQIAFYIAPWVYIVEDCSLRLSVAICTWLVRSN